MVDYIMETVPFEGITQWGRGSSLLHVYTHNRYLGHATLLLRDPNKGCELEGEWIRGTLK